MFKKIVGLGFPSSGKNKKDISKYIQELVTSGAGEFFTGYTPEYWSEKFGFEVSPNGRFSEHEQITTYETLKQVVQEVHYHGLEIFVNLNAWYYTDETLPYIERMIQEFQELRVDGIICGNISILEYLRGIGYSGKINISTILAVYNSEAIRFLLENYTINKVILSRELTLKEIETIVTDFPQVSFEVFGEGDFCRYNNGLCYAEHKYGAKDICTIVVDDLIYTKRYRPDFKKIVLDISIDEEEKTQLLKASYQDDSQTIQEILQTYDIFGEISDIQKKQLIQILYHARNRVDLFYDGMKPFSDSGNQKVVTYLKGINYALEHDLIGENDKKIVFQSLKKELQNSINSGFQYYKQQIWKQGSESKLKAQELARLYAKGDNLNLYSYLFFSRFSNIDTVKFPTRGRDYSEKIKLIEEVLREGKVSQVLLDRGVSIKRSHYDLTYLFENDRLWFRNNLKRVR